MSGERHCAREPRAPERQVFGVLQKQDVAICPVAAVDAYAQGARDMGIDLVGHGRYLFPPWRESETGGVVNAPLASGQLNADLQCGLRRCNLFEGETWHGVRSGGSIEMSLEGERLSEVMRKAGWSSKGMAAYYMKEWQVMCMSVERAVVPPLSSALEYERLNAMVGFCRAFV